MLTTNRPSEFILVVVFLASIIGVMLMSIATPDSAVSNVEKRKLKQWPIWSQSGSLKSYFSSITDYTNDQFAFRNSLVALNNKVKWGLGQSPSKHVIRGKDDWLFLKIEDPLLSQHVRGNFEMTKTIIDRATYVKEMYSKLTARGIAYQHIIAANKSTVYRGRLPLVFSMTNINASYDLFKSQFSALEREQQIFAEEVLGPIKFEHQRNFYFKNDTHWNYLGAYEVFKASIASLNLVYPDLGLRTRQKIFTDGGNGPGDLAKYIGLGDQLTEYQPATKFEACTGRNMVQREFAEVSQRTCNFGELRLLIIGDSFSHYLYPFYSEVTHTTFRVSQRLSRKKIMGLIEKIRPDVVIEELVERHIPARISK